MKPKFTLKDHEARIRQLLQQKSPPVQENVIPSLAQKIDEIKKKYQVK